MRFDFALTAGGALGLGGILVTAISPWGMIPALAGLGVLWLRGILLLRESRTDPLTGLGNLRALAREKKRLRRADPVHVCYLDVDDLKSVNDTRGHEAGDGVLRSVAQELRAVPDARAFRLGGDEFLLLSRRPAEVPRVSGAGTSVGYSQGPGRDLDELITRAEQDMYRRKLQKKASR